MKGLYILYNVYRLFETFGSISEYYVRVIKFWSRVNCSFIHTLCGESEIIFK